MNKYITVIGGGLAGTEAAYQIAKRGIKVKLYEMKPYKFSPAHSNKDLAEVVCSNSFKSNLLTNACGLLKEELRIKDERIRQLEAKALSKITLAISVLGAKICKLLLLKIVVILDFKDFSENGIVKSIPFSIANSSNSSAESSRISTQVANSLIASLPGATNISLPSESFFAKAYTLALLPIIKIFLLIGFSISQCLLISKQKENLGFLNCLLYNLNIDNTLEINYENNKYSY